LWLAAPCTATAVFGIYCLFSTFRSKIVLFQDRIEVHELFSTKVLSRQEIKGWRMLPTSPTAFVFVPVDGARRPVKVAALFRADEEFYDWLSALPCLDTEDVRSAKAEVRNDARLGATPGARMKRLAAGRHAARYLNIGALLLLLWGFLYPRPYRPVIFALVVSPWIAMELVRHSLGGWWFILCAPSG
jgi:hypothetical protein